MTKIKGIVIVKPNPDTPAKIASTYGGTSTPDTHQFGTIAPTGTTGTGTTGTISTSTISGSTATATSTSRDIKPGEVIYYSGTVALALGDAVEFEAVIQGDGSAVAKNLTVVASGKLITGPQIAKIKVNETERVTFYGATVPGKVTAEGATFIMIAGNCIISDKIKIEETSDVIVLDSTFNDKVKIEECTTVLFSGNTVQGEAKFEDNINASILTNNTFNGGLNPHND